MKILFTLFEINDWGGICADLVYKYKGLTEAGHEVHFCLLQDSDANPRKRGDTKQVGSYDGPIPGMRVNTRSGFFGIDVVSYGSDERILKWFKRCEKYDLIIHEIPGPNPAKTLSVDNRGYWYKMYQHDVPQIISAHDANFRDQYPQLIYIANRLKGISCTNQAGYESLSWFPAPRAFVGAPHPVFDWKKQKPWNKRKKQALSAHVWKAWKHMDMTVNAIPFVKDTKVVMAGDGIERSYMTAPDPDKRKPKYEGIWQRALDSGMDYRGMVVPDEIHNIYRDSRVMIDTSWSLKFMSLGCHFNRAIIEGYNNGCVPICIKENMIEDGFQIKMFQSGKTHFELSGNDSPRHLAQLIDHVANLKEDDAMAIVERGRKILTTFFDYKKSSLDYIKLAKGKPAGVYPKLETGSVNKTIVEAADAYIHSIDTKHRKDGRDTSESIPKKLAKEKTALESQFAKKSLF